MLAGMATATRDYTQSDYVVLGMVGMGARSGYQIKRSVELSIRYFWTISQAQIYPSLQRLEADGLIRGETDPDDRRRRRLYEITDSGQQALRAWLGRGEPLSCELRDVGMLKLFFADTLPADVAAGLVAEMRRRSVERIATLRQIESAVAHETDQGPVHPLLTLRMGVALNQAIADVCAEYEHAFADAR